MSIHNNVATEYLLQLPRNPQGCEFFNIVLFCFLSRNRPVVSVVLHSYECFPPFLCASLVFVRVFFWFVFLLALLVFLLFWGFLCFFLVLVGGLGLFFLCAALVFLFGFSAVVALKTGRSGRKNSALAP